ncbi:PIN domain-containing protein [Okibacterium fritillariae]|uniref:PIN domain-containing protein n=1 Tax=Okibacterium fritillariae TaxID=123320 RepID=UPI00405578A3
MARRLIVDTGVLVQAERDGSFLDGVVAEDDDLVIAAVTVAELLYGVELATDERRPRRERFVESIIREIPIEDYDDDVAETHAQLLAHTRRAGKKRGAHDLMIAATASVTRRTLLTTDRATHFGELPGVRCIEVG